MLRSLRRGGGEPTGRGPEEGGAGGGGRRRARVPVRTRRPRLRSRARVGHYSGGARTGRRRGAGGRMTRLQTRTIEHARRPPRHATMRRARPAPPSAGRRAASTALAAGTVKPLIAIPPLPAGGLRVRLSLWRRRAPAARRLRLVADERRVARAPRRVARATRVASPADAALTRRRPPRPPTARLRARRAPRHPRPPARPQAKPTHRYFDKILIANRGEISCRVSRTAHRLGACRRARASARVCARARARRD